MRQIGQMARKIAKVCYQSRFAIAALLLFVIGISVYVVLPRMTAHEYHVSNNQGEQHIRATTSAKRQQATTTVVHQETPTNVKAVYMSACAAANSNFRADFQELFAETEINSVVIDIKDYTGTISFSAGGKLGGNNKAAEGCRVSDMRSFIKELHEDNIYVIGRITAFQDPFYAAKNPSIAIKEKGTATLWSDNEGLHYIDPGAKQAWRYLKDIGKAAYRIGFDELNYDYIRYPSDGDTDNMQLPISSGRQKRAVLKDFFAYLESSFADSKVVISADIFGMTTTNADDQDIGQVLEDALAHFDYVAPMTYPSHYSHGFMGLEKPAEKPYTVMHKSLQSAVERIADLRWTAPPVTAATSSGQQATSTHATPTPPWGTGSDREDAIEALTYEQRQEISKSQLRPWIQDFDLGDEYTPEMVRAQIRALNDLGIESWMLWDPSNTYTQEALRPATSTDATTAAGS